MSTIALLKQSDNTIKQLSVDEINNWQPSDGYLWIHVNPNDKSILRSLKKKGHLSNLHLERIWRDEVRTQATTYENSFYCILRAPNPIKGSEEDMISIRICALQHLTISYMRQQYEMLNPIINTFTQGEKTLSFDEIFLSISELIMESVSHHSEVLTEEVDEIEDLLLEQSHANLLDDITHLQRKLLTYRRYLIPLKDTMKRLLDMKFTFISSELALRLHPAVDNIIRSLENTELNKEKCYLFMQMLSNSITNQLNNRIYLFSLIAVIFLPITAISGIFGMNVGGLPFINTVSGFGIVLFIMTFITALLLVMLKRSQWL